MKFLSAAVLALTATIVSAQGNGGVLFTSPLTGTVWQAGSTGLITWTVVDTSVTTISTIDLRQGPATALQLVQNVATNVPTSPPQYSWSIPATLAPGNDYALTFFTSPNISYSGSFSITAGSGASSNASSSAVASTSSAAPTSSAPASSTSAPSTSAAPSSSAPATSASASAAPSSTPKSDAAAVKAGVAGAGLVAGALALLL
ncbi:unnamed protein product [Umbelopsis vinacea]